MAATALGQEQTFEVSAGERNAVAVPVSEETWVIRVYAIESPFLFDLRSEQRLVTDSPLRVNAYHYGGMGLRGARSWLRHPEHDFLTNLGKTREDGNHSRAHCG